MKETRQVVFRNMLLGALVYVAGSAIQAQAPPAAAPTQAAPSAGAATTPLQRADATAKGKLKNPYAESDAAVVEAGGKLYLKDACNGCHGGTGGGGICPPLADGVWIYGGDDDTLFRLVAYGTQTLQSQGYSRKALPTVVAPMPAMGTVVATDDDLWRILIWIRAQYHGPPECKFGCPSAASS